MERLSDLADRIDLPLPEPADLGPAVALALAGLFLLAIALRAWRARRRGAKARFRPHAAPVASLDPVERALDQMRAVTESGFERVALLNREEAALLPVLDRAAEAAGCRVMAQVSLGEAIRPADPRAEEARAAVNSKRLDFAFVDRRGLVTLAVEYQGTGHWQGHAPIRDAVKREALRRAGVRVLEVHPGWRGEAVLRAVAEALRADEAGHAYGRAPRLKASPSRR